MKLWEGLKSKGLDASAIVNKAFDQAVKQTGTALDSDTAKAIKTQTMSAVETAGKLARNLSDLNGDGKVDVEDLKVAAEKAGIAWEKVDPDLKTALVSGGVAGIGVNFIPIVGQAIAVPAFVATAAYFFLVAKLTKLKSGRPENVESKTSKVLSEPRQVASVASQEKSSGDSSEASN